MTVVWKPGYSFDSDASTYIDAVETADGQALETGVRVAINDFVLGCKQDEIWDAIKASCILAGARTLDGALVPLVGGAPTNNNFVSADYDRETGLVGDGSTKYLDSNRADNADPQNSAHLSVYVSTADTAGANTFRAYAGAGNNLNSFRALYRYNAFAAAGGLSSVSAYNRGGFSRLDIAGKDSTGFIATNRASSAEFTGRAAQTNAGPLSNTSSAASSINVVIFAENANGLVSSRSNARLSFYSIGESLDLAALDTRVSNLITAIGAAIP